MEKTANFKVGDKVRILNVDKILYGRDYWKNGDVTEIKRIDGDGDIRAVATYGEHKRETYLISTNEFAYIEKVSEKPTKNQRISALESEVATLTRRIEALEQGKSYTHTPRKSVEVITPIGANQARKAIIDEAKAFVETEGNTNYVACHYDYHVNVEKRTVVALRIGNHSGTVRARGIAKCAPDDVFNADIGKAIALGRALGLDVERFEQAVKPTEFAVGQSFEWDTSYDTRIETITEIKKGSAYVKNGGWFWLTRAQQSNYRIIDDTEAQYV